jgi:hypothetical protein
MTGSRFVKDLTRLVRDMATIFRAQSHEWHSNLAKCVLPLAVHEEHYPKIAALKMIPLRDGTWVSTSPENIFFPGDQHGLTVPSGIDLMIVDSDAAADFTRKQLFIGLSVKEFTTLGICKMIIHTHNDPKFSPQQIEKAALIEQAVFLYRARWRLEERYKFFCVTESNRRTATRQLYMQSDKPYSASGFFATNRSRVQFLNSSYVDAVSENQESWLDWLQDGLNIATYPRLTIPSGEHGFVISPDFDWILSNRPSADYLSLLKNQWHLYENFVEEDEQVSAFREPNVSRSRIRRRLLLARVKCRDGNTRTLEKAYLPTSDLVTASKGCIPFLDVPDPQDRRWAIALRQLGVGLKNDLQFYLLALENIKSQNPTLDQVIDFLEQIQARSSESIAELK